MPTERIQRRIDALLDEADAAITALDWPRALELARAALAFDAENEDARGYEQAALQRLNEAAEATPPLGAPSLVPPAPSAQPSSFAAGRYEVRRFLGEGGKKRVFLAHDTRLDRDVAFALIKTDGLDEVGRERVTREAQAMGRLGAHPHLVSIYDIGDEGGSPYVVTELLGGGDVEALLASEAPLPLARTLEIAKDVCRGLAFAHAQGVVHRDLKPGNVWLTSDGVAKIGDFGLAVALDRSRLTTHGLMVGTVAYMPPEQALGGEVTPQADLYSLGAMLYELVTGKPPFQADDPTAVISQHINTPPVAPSWHTEHCPPDLEALILHLLAKVPADRPSSATEVLEALERVDPEGRSASHSDSSANPLDRLARGVFVGRERELERLRSAFDEAFAGRGSVVMLVGEPGIGKTRTVQELETYARMRGAKVFWGRSHEAGGAPPFWPWVQIGRAWRDETPDLEASEALRPYAIELQRIFPALRERFPGLPEPPSLDSEEAQFRLFDAFASFLHSVSAETPLVLVLDDLHWADRATLQLLAHVARELGRARLLVVGTYRDTDLDRRHPLSQALAELNRERLFQRIPLRGLGAPEVGEYVRRSAGVEPGRELVARLHEETEGNAFFLSEVVSLLTQEGTLESRSLSDVAIPEGVREALGRRLDRLSEDANSLLATLAVAGREFEHALVRDLSEHDDDATLALLEEALRAHVLEETGSPGRYRFVHALMQETLLDELSAARRVQLHGRIAEALERLFGPDDLDHLAEVANHYAESAVMNDQHRLRAADYAARAGDQARFAGALEDTVTLYRRAVDLWRDEHPAGERAEVWASLGRCLQYLLFSGDAQRAFSESLRLFQEAGDDSRFADVALDALNTPGRPAPERRSLVDEATAAARRVGAAAQEAMILLAAAPTTDDWAPAVDRARAVLSAERDSRLESRLVFAEAYRAAADFDLERAPALAQAAFEALDAAGDYREARNTLFFHAAASELRGGHVDAYERLVLQSAEYERRRHVPSNALSGLVAVALLRGDLPAAERAIEDLWARTRVFTQQLVAVRLAMYKDSPAAALNSLEAGRSGVEGLELRRMGARARLVAIGGDTRRAQGLATEYATLVASNVGQPMDWASPRMTAIDHAIMRSEVASMIPDQSAREAYARLMAISHVRASLVELHDGASVDRARGQLALRLDLLDEAADWLGRAVEWCERESLAVELARSLLALVTLCERRGDLPAARGHLDEAAQLFARHGAVFYLDQVIARKQVLGA